MSCPICAKDSDARYRPFCSKRCSDLDLGKWLTGAYTVPVEDDDAPQELARAMQESARKPH